MALPFLPGNSFNRKLGNERFHKSSYLERIRGTPYVHGDHKPGIGGEPLPGQRRIPHTSEFPPGVGSALPTWLAFDKQCLSFDAYFQETVDERREEQYRIRRVKLYFYPEDDTIQIFEPRVLNSGISQGTLVRRQRIAKPAPNHDNYYTVYDLNVGCEFAALGRVYRLVACDQFTANFLLKLGVQPGQPEAIPDDPYSNNRKAFTESMQPLRPYERIDRLRQFLDHDRNVLRFYCCWDDSKSLYGDVRNMVLHYYLADDTIEIREVIPPNSGRDEVPCFLGRQKLPRKHGALPMPGQITDRTLLNVFKHPQRGGHFVIDSLKLGAKPEDFYTDRDLTIGSSLNVHGRKFWLCDCDEFTKEYYRLKYGVIEFEAYKPNLPDSNKVSVTRELPPFNGWGSEVDSLGNCHALVPDPPKFDLTKFIELDRKPCEANCLRFSAHLLPSTDLVNAPRGFIVSCFLFDDSISVYEHVQINSGFNGGTFLRRGKIKLPGQNHFPVQPSKFYTSADLWLGREVDFNGFKFLLDDADTYALNYLEQHASSTQYAFAHLPTILAKVKGVLRELGQGVDDLVKKVDGLVGTDTCSFYQLRSLLEEIMSRTRSGQSLLSLHEVITIARNYLCRPMNDINNDLLKGLAQQQLHRQVFDDFPGMLLACKQQDVNKTGLLTRMDLRRICLAMHLPLPDDMLSALMDSCAQKDCADQIDYRRFLSDLNWRCNLGGSTSTPCDFTGNLPIDWSPISRKQPARSLGRTHRSQSDLLTCIEWKRLLADLCH